MQLAQSADEAIQLTTARRVAFSALARVSPTTILEDATVPRSELANMIRFIQQTAAKYEVTVGTFGHMGDGNLHPTFLTNEKNEAEMARVERRWRKFLIRRSSWEAPLPESMASGWLKKPFLPRAIGADSLCLMRQLTDCVQDLAFSHVNRDTADALLANGCEVVTPRAQFCCGSIHAHNGEFELAKQQARRNLDAFDLKQLDAVITNAAGCGSAGVYNITQPEMSQKLLRRKMANIATTGAEVVASANPGCSVQLQAGVCESNLKLKVAHPISLLAQAYRDAKHASAQQNL